MPNRPRPRGDRLGGYMTRPDLWLRTRAERERAEKPEAPDPEKSNPKPGSSQSAQHEEII